MQNMPQLLISLIGEQPIPNLLPLWQFQEFTATQFIASQTTLNIAETLTHAIRQDKQLSHLKVFPTQTIEAYNIGLARAGISAVLSEHLLAETDVRLNLTGGTKIMSLAALQAAFGSGVRLMYVSTEENRIILLGSDGAELDSQPIDVKITVDQYLKAHGLEVSDNQNFDPNYYAYAAPPPKAGDELEMSVYQALKQSTRFDDVRRKIFIRKQTQQGEVNNELDIVAIRNGRLAVCSCKSISSEKQEQVRIKIQKAIYELASLSRREAFGIYCGKILATDIPEPGEANLQRAKEMGVRLVCGEEIKYIALQFKLVMGC